MASIVKCSSHNGSNKARTFSDLCPRQLGRRSAVGVRSRHHKRTGAPLALTSAAVTELRGGETGGALSPGDSYLAAERVAGSAAALWDVETRPRDGLRVWVALVAPFSVVGALLWFVITEETRHYLGWYLTAGGLMGAALWFYLPILQGLRSRNFVLRMLRRAVARPVHRIGLWGDNYDVETMDRHGISVVALWPLARTRLSRDERDLLASEAARMRTALAGFASSGVALIATCVAVTAALASGNASRPMFVALLAATLCIVFGSLLRFRLAAPRVYSEKLAAILRHAAEITGSYGEDEVGASVIDQLRTLTLRRLQGELLAAEAADRGELPPVESLRAAVRDSFQEALAPTPPITMEGAIAAQLQRNGAGRWTLDIDVRVDPAARSAAIDRRGAPGVAAFLVSGGRSEPRVPVELVIDAPGLVVETRGALAAVLSTTGGKEHWTVALTGAAPEDDEVWVSLYSVGRFVQAVRAALGL